MEAIRSLKLDNRQKNIYPVVPVRTTSCCCRHQYRQTASISGGRGVLLLDTIFCPEGCENSVKKLLASGISCAPKVFVGKDLRALRAVAAKTWGGDCQISGSWTVIYRWRP